MLHLYFQITGMVTVGMVINLVLELQVVRVLDILPQKLIGLQVVLSHQFILLFYLAKSLTVAPEYFPPTGARCIHYVVCPRVSKP